MGWSKGIIAVVLSFVSTIVVAPAHARTPAPGAPGAKATWLPADKHGFGTAAARGSTVWFTLRASAMTEAYYPAAIAASSESGPAGSLTTWRPAGEGTLSATPLAWTTHS